MSKSHNKKRNAGLLYEFLVKTISQALVEGDQKKSARAVKLIRRHFRPGTNLHREYRLINSLVRTTVSSEAVAASILQEAKNAARSYNVGELDREKSLLISTINKALNDEHFFDRPVNEYRMYATVQTLINDWRTADADLGRIAKYEDQLVKWLVTEKTQTPDSNLMEENQGTGRLLMKVMMKRLNEKYAGLLSNEQKQLIRAYAFSTANDETTSIKLKLSEVRDSIAQRIDTSHLGSEYVASKLQEVRSMIIAENLDEIDDNMVARFMLYAKLNEELSTEDK